MYLKRFIGLPLSLFLRTTLRVIRSGRPLTKFFAVACRGKLVVGQFFGQRGREFVEAPIVASVDTFACANPLQSQSAQDGKGAPYWMGWEVCAVLRFVCASAESE
jgi:hypothetical protein